MPLKSKKENRKDILKLAKEGRELHDYLIHIANLMVDPKKHDLTEREIITIQARCYKYLETNRRECQ